MPVITGWKTFLTRRAAYIQMKTSYGEAPAHRPHVVVQLFAGDTWGWGEGSPLPHFTGETVQVAQQILEEKLLPALVGLDPSALGLAHALMEKAVPGNPTARAAADSALIDLAGKLAGVPAAHLLGGSARAQVRFAGPLGITDLDAAVERARRLVSQGVTTLKMKVGQDYEADVARVRAVRAAVGPAVHMRVDANQGYDYPTAHRVLTALKDVGLIYAEQPLPAWDVEGAAALRREIGVPIAADEGVRTLQDAVAQIQNRAADVFILKLVKMGGMWRARQIAALAEAYRIGCVVVSTYDTQLGGSACLHLAQSLPNAPYAHELTVFATQPELARTAHRVEGGAIIPGQAPGLGVMQVAELPDLVSEGEGAR